MALAKGCSGDSRITTDGGKTDIWYDGVADKSLLITMDATDASMTMYFGAAQPF